MNQMINFTCDLLDIYVSLPENDARNKSYSLVVAQKPSIEEGAPRRVDYLGLHRQLVR